MIALARVDDRLVHGQVTVGWVPHVQATLLIVASDRVAADPLLAGILRAGTACVRVEVLSVVDAVTRGAGRAWERERVLLLFETLQDALRAVEAGLAIPRLNLGGLRHDAGSLCVCDGVTLDHDDCDVLRRLGQRGVQIDVRLMPQDRVHPLPDALPGGRG